MSGVERKTGKMGIVITRWNVTPHFRLIASQKENETAGSSSSQSRETTSVWKSDDSEVYWRFIGEEIKRFTRVLMCSNYKSQQQSTHQRAGLHLRGNFSQRLPGLHDVWFITHLWESDFSVNWICFIAYTYRVEGDGYSLLGCSHYLAFLQYHICNFSRSA